MTTESVTPVQQRKLVCIADEVTVLEKPPADDTPLPAALQLVTKAVASHPEPIQVFIKSIYQEFNFLKSKQRQQKLSIKNLTKDNFLPRSTRIQFKLTTSESVMETTDLKRPHTNVEKALTTYQKACKTAILETTLLVNEEMKKKASSILVKTLLNLSQLTLLMKDPAIKDDSNNHRLAYYMAQHHLDSTVFSNTWTTRVETLAAIRSDDITADHMATDDAAEPATQDATTTASTPWQFDFDTSQFFDSMKDLICTLILTIFVSSWQAQLDAYNKKAVNTALAVATKEIMGTEATDRASQVVDAEPTVGPKKTKELINNAVQQKTKIFYFYTAMAL